MQDAKLFQMLGFATVLPRALLPQPGTHTACPQPGQVCTPLLSTLALPGWWRRHAGATQCPCHCLCPLQEGILLLGVLW